MLSRVTLDRSEIILDKTTEGGVEYPTLNVISADGINYLTIAPGFKEGCVSLALNKHSDDASTVIYHVLAPHSNLLYYSTRSIMLLLDKIIYNNTGLSIDHIAITYHDLVTDKKMFGEYLLEETEGEFSFTRTLQDLRIH